MEMSLICGVFGETFQHLFFCFVNTIVPLFVVVSISAQCCKKKNYNLEGAETPMGQGQTTPATGQTAGQANSAVAVEDKTQRSSKIEAVAGGDAKKETEKKADDAKNKKESSKKEKSKKETSKKEVSKKSEVKKDGGGSKKEEVKEEKKEGKEEEKKEGSEKEKSKAGAAKDEKKDDDKKEEKE